jgi:hypothetical protein
LRAGSGTVISLAGGDGQGVKPVIDSRSQSF